MSRLIHFMELRRNRLSLSMASSMSGMDRYFGRVLHILGWIVCIASILYLLSDQANAIGSAADNRTAAKLHEQATYIKALETILSKCLSPGDNAITIGGEVAFCGLAMTGIRR